MQEIQNRDGDNRGNQRNVCLLTVQSLPVDTVVSLPVRTAAGHVRF